jgi:hypothetical protein
VLEQVGHAGPALADVDGGIEHDDGVAQVEPRVVVEGARDDDGIREFPRGAERHQVRHAAVDQQVAVKLDRREEHR